MAEERFKLYGAVYLMLHRDNKILLSRRCNTGWQDGNYSLVSGHIDGRESFVSAMCREAKEEAGIVIKPKDIRFAHAMHRLDPIDSREYIDIAFVADSWQGEITNKEPNKCDDLSWFDINNLPTNLIPAVKQFIDCYNKGTYYSEFGWDQS